MSLGRGRRDNGPILQVHAERHMVVWSGRVWCGRRGTRGGRLCGRAPFMAPPRSPHWPSLLSPAGPVALATIVWVAVLHW